MAVKMKNKFWFLWLLFNWSVAAYSGGREYAVTRVVSAAGALSLGNAYAAHEADAVSFCWNPGSLAFVEKTELSTLQSHLTTDADFFSLSGVLPLPQIKFGLNWSQLQMAGIPETVATLNNNEVIRGDLLTYSENSVVLALAGKLSDRVGLGLSLRHIDQQTAMSYGSGWSAAAGLYWRLPQVSFGLAVENLGAYQKYNTGYTERLPPVYLLGLSWRILPNLVFAQDWRQMADSRVWQTYTGAAFFPAPRIRLALGYMDGRLTAGAGLAVGQVTLDYAYAAQNDSALGSDQYISLGVRW